MIIWREKFIATGLHFVVTLLLATVAAALIFVVWYPSPFHRMIGGSELFLLIIGTDLVLGPLISLVIYDRRKSRRALLIDYCTVGLVQIAAMSYGVSIMSAARPAYIAFSADRFEIVAAGDLTPKELAQAREARYASVPWTGPRYVAVVVPEADYQDALFEALAGNEEHHRPKFYVSYESQLDVVRRRSKLLEELVRKKPEAAHLLDDALRDVRESRERLKWLPVRHLRGFWTAIVDDSTGKIVAWLPLDPYD